MGSPAGSSGTGTGSTANVYTPQGQPTADFNYWQTLQPLINSAGGTPGAAPTPGAYAYPQAQQALGALNPSAAPAQAAVAGAGLAGQYATGTLSPALQGASSQLLGTTPQSLAAGNSILQAGFDPQQALYQHTLNQTTQQAAAQNANSGVLGSPYGQSVADQATNNFNINWQNQQLGRETSALGAYDTNLAGAGNTATTGSNLGTAATTAESTGAALPYNTGASIASNDLQGLGSTVNIGNQQYTLPQQVLGDLQSYLGLGQTASTISGNLGAQGLGELGQATQGIGNLLGQGAGAASSLAGS